MSGVAQKGQGRRSIARRITRPRRTLGEIDHEKLAVPLNLEFRSSPSPTLLTIWAGQKRPVHVHRLQEKSLLGTACSQAIFREDPGREIVWGHARSTTLERREIKE